MKKKQQKRILFELLLQESLDKFGPIIILLAPPGSKDVRYIQDVTKHYYLHIRFKEISIKCSPKKIFSLLNNMQATTKQYRIQHYVSGKIHYAMRNTFPSIAMSLSLSNRNCSIWDKWQLLVVIS